MKTLCQRCGRDYLEVFEDGSGAYCFGCGHRESVIVLSNKEARRQTFKIIHECLEDRDYQRLHAQWGITRAQADRYGLGIADAGWHRWLYLPVYDDQGKEIHCQLRKWSESCPRKYMTKTQPPPGLIWKSWKGKCPSPLVAVVEGVLDGIRVGEVLPAVALFGSAANREKVEAITQVVPPDAFFLVLLDGDVPHLALKVAQQLGLTRSRVVLLAHGQDPTDLTREELAAELGVC